jgi:hypothetical protein
VSLYAVQKYLTKFTKKDFILFLMIAGILISSISFYEYKKMDYEKEKEFNEIAKKISRTINGINYHPTETRYIGSSEIPNEWPFVYYDELRKTSVVPTENYTTLESFIFNSKNNLTHLLVDENIKLPKFLQEVYHNEKEFKYLNKIFDSKELGFKHHLKLFKINYNEFDLEMQRNAIQQKIEN